MKLSKKVTISLIIIIAIVLISIKSAMVLKNSFKRENIPQVNLNQSNQEANAQESTTSEQVEPVDDSAKGKIVSTGDETIEEVPLVVKDNSLLKKEVDVSAMQSSGLFVNFVDGNNKLNKDKAEVNALYEQYQHKQDSDDRKALPTQKQVDIVSASNSVNNSLLNFNNKVGKYNNLVSSLNTLQSSSDKISDDSVKQAVDMQSKLEGLLGQLKNDLNDYLKLY